MRFVTLIACLCMALLALPRNVFATDVNQAWLQTFQNSGGEVPSSFAVDSQGSVYVVSDWSYTGIGYAWFIRKMNSLGILQWSQTFFAAGPPVDVAADASGNVFLTGSTISAQGLSEAITLKYLSDGELTWATVYPHAVAECLHVDATGNCYVGGSVYSGGANQTLLLEYNTKSALIGASARPEVFPSSCFFMPNGELVSVGTAGTTDNAAFEVVSNTGFYVFGESQANTNTDTYNYLLTCDTKSNVYLVVRDVTASSDTFTVNCTDSLGNSIWTSQPDNGAPVQVTASDTDHAYVQAFTQPSSYVDFGYKTGGVKFMTVQGTSGTIAADRTVGLITTTQSPTTFTYNDINQDLDTLWVQTVTGAQPIGIFKLTIINGTVYSLNDSALADNEAATQMVKFVQGIGITTVTPSQSSIQGGNSVNLTVQLNDIAPAAGLNAYFVSNSSALGLPTSVLIPAGKSSLTVTALTDPVDVATTVSIAGEVNGGIRTTTVVLTPAALHDIIFSDGVIGSVVGGQTITGTVQLAGPTALLAHTVTLSSNSAKATVPASVTIAAGASSATFVVHTTQVTVNTKVIVTAKMAGVTVTGTLNVTP